MIDLKTLPNEHPLHLEVLYAKVPKIVKDKLLVLMSKLQSERLSPVTYTDVICYLVAKSDPEVKKILEDTPYAL